MKEETWFTIHFYPAQGFGEIFERVDGDPTPLHPIGRFHGEKLSEMLLRACLDAQRASNREREQQEDGRLF